MMLKVNILNGVGLSITFLSKNIRFNAERKNAVAPEGVHSVIYFLRGEIVT